MKIIFLTSGSVKSNFTYRMVQLSSSLVKLGHDVSLIAPIADKYNNFVPEKITEINGVKIIQPFQFKTKRVEINLLPYILHTIYILLTNKADMVYIYKPTPITVVGLISKFIFKTKTVLDMDDVGSEVMKIEGHPWHQIMLVEWCEYMVSKYSDKIVTASTFLENRYRQMYKNKPILTISNGVDSSWFKDQVAPQKKNKVVFMGSINRINILEPLFESLKNIKSDFENLEVLIMGDGKFLNHFKDLSEKYNLNDIVKFTGWLKLEDAENMLRAGDIGYNFMPDELTTKSASNMKVMQYMARGVVPIVSNIGDLPAYVDFGRAGYICEPNTQSLTVELVKALKDEDRILKSTNAVLYAKNNFDWDILAKKVSDWMIGKDNSKIKKLYFVAINLPDNVGGGEIRNYHQLKSFSQNQSLKTKLFCIATGKVSEDKQKIESDLGISSFMVPESDRTIYRTLKSLFIDRVPPFMNDFQYSGLGEVFFEECKKELPDVVQLQQLHSYYMIKKYIPWLRKNKVKIVLDSHNIEFKLLRDTISLLPFYKRIFGKILIQGLKSFEIKAIKNSDLVLTCSRIDYDFIKKYNSNIKIIPNGVDVDDYKNLKPSGDNAVIFMGGVAYPPNADAVRYYISDIHPKIKKEIPDIKAYLVGTDEKWLQSNDESVIPLGFVPDIKPYLEKASIGICPIRYGSGTRLKILTYMAGNLPVVSTSKGAEGVDYKNGSDLFIENNADDFAFRVITLLNDKNLAKQIAQNGQNFVSENFDWKSICSNLNKVYETI